MIARNIIIKLLIICIIYTAIIPIPAAEEYKTEYILPPEWNDILLPIEKNMTKMSFNYVDLSREEINVPNEEIDELQDKIDKAGFNWMAGKTSVSDLTIEEKSHLCGLPDEFLYGDHITQIPETGYVAYLNEINWCNRNGKNWMTPVKNQGSCGSCWAFSVLGSIEARINIESGYPSMDVDLSEQHLVSDCCDTGDCDGGWPDEAFEYVMSEGISTEEYFPYLEMDSPCIPHSNWTRDICTIDDIIYFYTYDNTLKWALENYGPLSISLRINASDWSYYDSGIFESINEHTSGHAVVLVGYSDIGNYWIIKNSWGENWGEDGYMRIKYGDSTPYRYGIIATNIKYSIPGDQYEPDDTYDDANFITVGEDYTQRHDFHDANDEDVIKFIGTPGEIYTIETEIIGNNSDTHITFVYYDTKWNYIYDDDSGDGLASKIIHKCNNSHTNYIRVRHYYSDVYGTNTDYYISVTKETTNNNIITIEDVTLNHNTTIDVPIRLMNSTGIGASLVTLTFDPSIVNITNVVAGDLDDVFVPNYSNIDTGTLRIACMELGTDMSGDLIIATITLDAIGTNGSCTLNLSVDLTTAKGIAVSSSIDNGIFTIRDRILGDVTGDGDININDAMLLFNWVSFVNERETTYALAEPDNANVNGDDRINIGDAVLLFNWVLFPEEREIIYILR